MLIEPPHVLAEMCAVLARESPQTMAQDLRDLLDLGLPMEADPAVYEIAMQLSRELGHHLFDTLYHALALPTEGALLVTADTTYARKAGHLGRLLPLRDWALGAGQDTAVP
jgi:predicted nucleic acid-binding protein